MSPSRRPLRIALLAVAAVLVLAVGIGAVLIARFDPNTYKPDIAQAARRATGRDLALNGKISLKPSLWPTIQVTDVAFSNPPGFSRPQMANCSSPPRLAESFPRERILPHQGSHLQATANIALFHLAHHLRRAMQLAHRPTNTIGFADVFLSIASRFRKSTATPT